MTITVTTDVFCDGCNDWVHGYTGPRVSREEARAAARRAGWLCTTKGDFCPDCRDKAVSPP